MRKPGKYTGDGNIELTPEQAELVDRKIAEADAEYEAARVNFRWDKKHLDVVKAAAEVVGVPYQIYIKMVLFDSSVRVLGQCADILQNGPEAIWSTERMVTKVSKNSKP